MSAITDYLAHVENEFQTGIAAEHAYRPALETLLETAAAGLNAVNDPKRTDIGMPDFQVLRANIPIGIVEAKDIGVDLDRVENSEQMGRYLKFGNVILTDYLEFRWYVGREKRWTVRVAEVKGRKISPYRENFAELERLLRSFATETLPTVRSARDLAERMAEIAQEIRHFIEKDLTSAAPSVELTHQMEAFQRTLLPGLDESRFADMVAQTVAYGLFAARVNHSGDPQTFNRYRAAADIPRTNPFLRKLFHGMEFNLGERLTWLVDRLVDLLAHTDTDDILRDFGRQTRQEDPVVHFYETFLSAYDPQMRERRGVYYTPEPVVSYIVRSVDHLLKTRFNRPDGLADPHTLILDPATGTGTFLFFVIQHIYEQLVELGGQRGLWSAYVRDCLLPRIFGFELLMAPYTIAHMKLGLLLEETGYDLAGDQRLGIYLTNTLEEGVDAPPLPMAEFISAEANEAAAVKRDKPIMVVLGNPPYSKESANQGEWIANLIGDYRYVDGKPLGERNPKWLQDDYVKFIRFGQWRIEQTGSGILAFVTNHGYLDNPTFRGMRQQLMQTFTDIYILDLHGSSRKEEISPDGSVDENVFDIMQGVSVGVFVKQPGGAIPVRVHHYDLWGKRANKYHWLFGQYINTIDWLEIKPQSPYYLFIPQNIALFSEYNRFWLVPDIFNTYASTVTTARNHFSLAFDRQTLLDRIANLRDKSIDDDQIREKYNLRDVSYWGLADARRELFAITNADEFVRRYCYRPFDFRYIYYHRSVCERLRTDVMQHMEKDNLALLTHRPQSPGDFTFAYCTTMIGDQNVAANKSVGGGNSFQFPIYAYPEQREGELFATDDDGSPWPLSAKGRRPNLNPAFVQAMAERLGLEFRTEGAAFGPHPLNPPLHDAARGTSGPAPTTGLPFPDAARGTSGPAAYSPLPTGDGPGDEVSPPLQAMERGPGGEVLRGIAPPPALWEKLKPLARQKRHDPTLAEHRLWEALRNRQVAGAKFRRQHAIDRFIVDFYCAEAALVIEVDGEIHEYTQEEDAIRQEFLESCGLRVIRFTNAEVLHATEAVLQQIESTLTTPPLDDVVKGTSAPAAYYPLPQGEEPEDEVSPPLQAMERGPGGEVWYGPEDVFHYAYAVFHSPTYRDRYAEFLKIDFPRLPLTGDVELFQTLCELGAELVALHLMKHPNLSRLQTAYPVEGDNVVAAGHPRFVPAPQTPVHKGASGVSAPAIDSPLPPGEGPGVRAGRVYINPTQYFAGVPEEVWEFHVGGYQVLHKWLKDRKGRALSFDDLRHYQRIVVALAETIRLMEAIDAAIPAWPIA